MVFEKQEPPLLFDLAQDPGEKVDIAKEHPDIFADLQKELENHRQTIKPVQVQY